jgi:hypothetical protein
MYMRQHAYSTTVLSAEREVVNSTCYGTRRLPGAMLAWILEKEPVSWRNGASGRWRGSSGQLRRLTPWGVQVSCDICDLDLAYAMSMGTTGRIA